MVPNQEFKLLRQFQHSGQHLQSWLNSQKMRRQRMGSRCDRLKRSLQGTKPLQQRVADSLLCWMALQGLPQYPRRSWQWTGTPMRYVHSYWKTFSGFSSETSYLLELLKWPTWYGWQRVDLFVRSKPDLASCGMCIFRFLPAVFLYRPLSDTFSTFSLRPWRHPIPLFSTKVLHPSEIAFLVASVQTFSLALVVVEEIDPKTQIFREGGEGIEKLIYYFFYEICRNL